MDEKDSQLDNLLAALRRDIEADKALLQRATEPDPKPRPARVKQQAVPEM
jgi:hypothetical protein